MVELLGWLAASANLLGFLLYFRAMRERSTTSPVGWFLSTVIALSAAVSQFGVSSLASSASYFLGALCCATALVLSVRGRLVVTRADAGTACIALLVALLAVTAPVLSIYCLSAYYLLSYSVFLRAIKNGSREPVQPWLVWCAGAALQISSISLASASSQAYLLPITNLLCWISVAALAAQQIQFAKGNL